LEIIVPEVPEFRAIIVDIEATHLKADFGLVIMAGGMTLSPKWIDGDDRVITTWLSTMEALLRKEPVELPNKWLLKRWGIQVFRIDDNLLEFRRDNTNDKHVLMRLFNELANAQVVLGYNTEKFDLKFLRSRAAFWNLPFPSGFYHGDIYTAARRIFTLHNRSLDSVAAHLGLSLKTPVRPHIWLDALNVGERGKQARDYIAAHLIFDLLTTAYVYKRVWMHVKLRQVAI